MFNRNNVKTVGTTLASFATNGSSAVLNLFSPAAAAECVGLRVIASASQPLATTTASGLTVTLYKNASNAGSIIGTFNTSGTGITANDVAAGVMSTTTSLKKLAVGDVVLAQGLGGVAMGSTVGIKVEMDYVYGYED